MLTSSSSLLRLLLLLLLLCAAALLAGGDFAHAEEKSDPAAPTGNRRDAPLADPVVNAPSPEAMIKVTLSDEQWRARLTPEQYRVLRGAATERPFSCPLWKISDKPGVYHCAGCGLALFRSTDKFDSGTGWPSFTRPIQPWHVVEKPDRSHGMVRVETLCARCDGHLGHVFEDGPPPAGRRHCINGVALRFVPEEEQGTPKAQP